MDFGSIHWVFLRIRNFKIPCFLTRKRRPKPRYRTHSGRPFFGVGPPDLPKGAHSDRKRGPFRVSDEAKKPRGSRPPCCHLLLRCVVCPVRCVSAGGRVGVWCECVGGRVGGLRVRCHSCGVCVEGAVTLVVHVASALFRLSYMLRVFCHACRTCRAFVQNVLEKGNSMPKKKKQTANNRKYTEKEDVDEKTQKKLKQTQHTKKTNIHIYTYI